MSDKPEMTEEQAVQDMMKRINCGNKLNAISKVLEAANYIQEHQNSVDMQLPKSMLLKIAEIMIITVKDPIDRFVHIQTGGKIPMPNPERQSTDFKEEMNSKHHGCDDCSGECESEDANINVAQTIEKIKEELQNND